MKKKICLRMFMAGILSLSVYFPSMADYVEDTGYSASREYNRRLTPELDKTIQKLETLEAELEKLEEEFAELEPKYKETKEAYDAGEISFPEYHKIKIKYGNTENNIKSTKKVIEETKSKIDTLNELLEEATENAMEWTGYTNEGDEDITYTFKLVNYDGDWVLGAGYRGWNPFMGGTWEYSSFITDELRIGFYDGNTCLVERADRASEYDTETAIFWDVPDDLEADKKYYIKINHKTYGVYARDYSDYRNNHESSNTEESDWDDVENTQINNESDEDTDNHSTAKTGGWMNDDSGWWVQNDDGTYLKNQWYQSPDSGLWYYMGADGYMLTDTVTPDGYTVNADGVWVP